ncbi:MAG: hypothetical protein ACHQQQ_07430 [Bacteroidota bacterium]
MKKDIHIWRKNNSPFRVILRSEVNELFHNPRALHLIPLLLLGVFLMSWTYKVAPPFSAIILVVFCALEPQFNNLFYRSSSELETLNLFPIDWREIILAKNIATIILTAFSLIVCSSTLFFFSPSIIGMNEIGNGILYCLTIIFPILCYGNSRSLSNPRSMCGWQFTDFMEMLWMTGILLVFSIPYAVLASHFDYLILYLLYGVGNGLYWYYRSVPDSARLLNTELITILDRS